MEKNKSAITELSELLMDSIDPFRESLTYQDILLSLASVTILIQSELMAVYAENATMEEEEEEDSDEY